MKLSEHINLGSPFLERLFLALALSIVGCFIAWHLYTGHGTLEDQERERLATQARVIDENLGRQLAAVNSALASVRSDLPFLNKQRDGGILLNRRLQAMSDAMPGVRTLTVLNGEGTIVASNRAEIIGQNFREREYFQVARQSRDPDILHVSPPFKTSLGFLAINVVRVIPGTRGEFAGIVSATLDPQYFRTLLASVSYAPDMWAGMGHVDGKLFLMVPEGGIEAGQDLAKPGSMFSRHMESGQRSTVMTGVLLGTGEERMIAQRTIRPETVPMDKPMVIAVTRNLAAIFAPWQKEVFLECGLFAVLALVTATGLFFHQRRQRNFARIAARHEAEQQRYSEQYRTIIQTSLDGFWITDSSGRILDANEAICRKLGYSREELLCLSIADIEADESPEETRAHIREMMETGHTRFEARHRCKDGAVINVEISVLYQADLGERFFAFVRDVTERKLAEQQLRIAATSFEAQSGIVVTDTDDVILRVNRAFTEITGYTDTDAVGQKMNLLKSSRHGADFYAEMWEKIINEGSWQGEIWNRCKNGEDHQHWLTISAEKGGNNDTTHYVGTYTDITERKLLENVLRINTQRLNEAQRIAHVGSWTLDLLSGKLNWSDEIFRLFEIDANKFAATYEAFLNAIHPEDRDGVNKAYTDSLVNRTPYQITHRLLMSDGRIKWVDERCESDFDAQGKALRSTGTVQDITALKQAELEILKTNNKLQSLLDAIPDLLFEVGLDGRYYDYHSPRTDLLAAPADSLIGKTVSDVLPAEAAEVCLSAIREAKEQGVSMGKEFALTLPQGTLWFELSVASKHDSDDQNRRFIVLSRDVTARKQAEAELRIAAAAFESKEGMVITDVNSVILRVNRAFTEITGYTAAEAVGQTPRMLKSGRHNAEFYREMWDTILRTGGWQGELWDKRKSGEVYPKWLTISAVKDSDGSVTNYIGSHYDITARKKAEERINELTFFDQLTGLPNRTLLLDRLKQTMAVNSRSGAFGAVLFIDLDNFKTLNDTQGHDIGDMLLKQVALRLTLCVREGDTVARQGGDEFVVILAGFASGAEDAAAGIEAVAEKILAALNQTYQIGDVVHHSTASIGVTLFSGDRVTIDDLMKQADLAMYKAKAAGRNLVRFFDPTLESAVMERASMEDDLRQAMAGKQFLLYYQAQVVGEGGLSGAEALIRWQHPERGLVLPAEFISIAEETGLILPLGHWVLNSACTQLALWASRPEMAHLTIAVNVSANQFRQRDFVEQVLAVLQQTGANPQRLKLELTESLLVANVEDVIGKMFALKAKGVGFSLDDFGTGYSSLSYLKRLPLDQLKIDQSFVNDVLTDANDASIAKTIIVLAKSLGLDVIAEGVETARQLEFLISSGCHDYQGYFFSRPLPLGDFEKFVLRG